MVLAHARDYEGAAAALSGAVWFRWYARLLGARIGEGVDLHALPPVTGWLDVGAGAAMSQQGEIHAGLRVARMTRSLRVT